MEVPGGFGKTVTSHHCSSLKQPVGSVFAPFPSCYLMTERGVSMIVCERNVTLHLASKYRKASTSFSNFSKVDWILWFYVVIREKAFYSIAIPPNRKHLQYQKTNPRRQPLYTLFLTHSQQIDLNVKHFPKKHAMLLRFRHKFGFSVLQTREFLKISTYDQQLSHPA